MHFFRQDLGECLNDEPEITRYQFKNMLPGAVYDADFQCRLYYPNNPIVKACEQEPDKRCERLMCYASPGMCYSPEGLPAAEGTKCAENKVFVTKIFAVEYRKASFCYGLYIFYVFT